jgi:hypothetical protein
MRVYSTGHVEVGFAEAERRRQDIGLAGYERDRALLLGRWHALGLGVHERRHRCWRLSYLHTSLQVWVTMVRPRSLVMADLAAVDLGSP